MSTENEELQYWLEQESITNTDAFLAPDTPTGPSRSLINTRLDNIQKKHERIVERLINQQTWALSDFQAAFAERIDPSLFQTSLEKKSGIFETINGERFLVEKQSQILQILDQLQNVITQGKGEAQKDTLPEKLCAQRISEPIDPFTNQINIIYESELKVLRDRQKTLFADFQRDYIEQKGPLRQQLGQLEHSTLSTSPQLQSKAPTPVPAPATPALSIPTKRTETEAQPPPSSTKRIRFSSPPVQSRQESPRQPIRSNTSPSHKGAVFQGQIPPGPSILIRTPSRDPRIRNEQAAPFGRSQPETHPKAPRGVIQKTKATATANATPISAPSNYQNTSAPNKPANTSSGSMPPEVVSSAPSSSSTSSLKQHKHKPIPKGINAPLLDRGTMDMVGPDVFFIERQSKTRIHLGVAKDFDNALHAPQENSPIFVRWMQNDRWFYRRRDQARIGLVSKIEPMIRKYLLQT
ncbi:hypothetical protein BDA99DRAFT_563702 [Phascolomyces articulosus]|uniref:Uncharacterized protein n=1 Tax=Phascolomyces articulosus TaxID=60185 RepID=A0AAD5JRS2_9FUNG|nr:hypothetical protein BDA99DRAFT_563702 [Phascolomyces articulosus]